MPAFAEEIEEAFGGDGERISQQRMAVTIDHGTAGKIDDARGGEAHATMVEQVQSLRRSLESGER